MFDGVNDYISLNEPFFDGDSSVSEFSYSTWIYLDEYPNTSQTINLKEGYWRTIGLKIYPTGVIEFGGSQPSPNAYHKVNTDENIINTQQWNHIVVTFNDSTLKIFVNGNLATCS